MKMPAIALILCLPLCAGADLLGPTALLQKVADEQRESQQPARELAASFKAEAETLAAQVENLPPQEAAQRWLALAEKLEAFTRLCGGNQRLRPAIFDGYGRARKRQGAFLALIHQV